VGSYRLSLAADRDIEAITRLSIEAWGVDRAEGYVMDLHRVFEMLGTFPSLGRDIGQVRAGYFRFEHLSHTIFHRRGDGEVIVMRVLHRRQTPVTYL
jgi:toxin ParE1/3/4